MNKQQVLDLVNTRIQKALNDLAIKYKSGSITFAEKSFGEKALYGVKDDLNKTLSRITWNDGE